VDYLDYSGLSAIFARYYKRLVSYAKRYVLSSEEARDIVQDCFVKVWEQRGKYSDISTPALLFTMVRNACLDSLKHRCVVHNFRSDFFKSHDSSDSLYAMDMVGSMPGDGGLYDELLRMVCREVDKLPQRCREVFELSRFEGLSNAEIARRLQISEPAVHKSIDRAIGKLSKVLK